MFPRSELYFSANRIRRMLVPVEVIVPKASTEAPGRMAAVAWTETYIVEQFESWQCPSGGLFAPTAILVIRPRLHSAPGWS